MSATANVLENVGLQRATTLKIAEEAGVSVGSLYQYFTNKEAILTFFIERQLEAQQKLFCEKLMEWRDLPIRDLNRALVPYVVNYLVSNKRKLNALYAYAGQYNRMDWLMDLRRALADQFAVVLESHKNELRVTNYHRSATVVLHATMGVITSKILDAKMNYTKEEIEQELIDLFDCYLLKKE